MMHNPHPSYIGMHFQHFDSIRFTYTCMFESKKKKKKKIIKIDRNSFNTFINCVAFTIFIRIGLKSNILGNELPKKLFYYRFNYCFFFLVRLTSSQITRNKEIQIKFALIRYENEIFSTEQQNNWKILSISDSEKSDDIHVISLVTIDIFVTC